MNKVIRTEDELDEWLSEPSAAVLEALCGLDSNLLVLGAGGKMGPTLARMAARALHEIGSPYAAVGVSRFSQPGAREQRHDQGNECTQRGAQQEQPDQLTGR